MTDVAFYEKVNRDWLRLVNLCDNIPFENTDESDWKDSFIKGLKLFKREVRKYLAGEYYDDLDFVNCYPVIL